jgi:hypothetical protein
LQDSLAALWTLTEEIDGLPHDFPQFLRTAFARATRAGVLASAFGEAYYLVRNDRWEAQRWAERVGATAPNVQAIMMAALAYAPPPQPAARTSSRFGLMMTLMFALFIVGGAVLVGILSPKDPPPPLHDINGFYSGPPRPRAQAADGGASAR